MRYFLRVNLTGSIHAGSTKTMTQVKIDKIIRSKRKTLSFEITRDAKLIVRAPETIPLDYIEKSVSKKQAWITDKQKLVTEIYSQVRPKEFVHGEGFLYLGQVYGLSVVDNGEPPFKFDGEFHLSRTYLPQAKELFIDWYKKQAYRTIKERVDRYAGVFGFKYNKFSITRAQRRWGSCSSSNNLHFSWRLIMAPLNVIDYVVIHELAHIEEKNHSKRFWNKVRLMFPDFESSLHWLRRNEHLLVI